MSFSKKKREAVYAKYDGHCAYCGRAIDIKDMLLSQEASKNQLAEEFAPYLTEFYQNLESIITDLADAATDSGIIDLLGSLLDLASALSPVLSGLADAASSL